jgi:hypothetical protein
MEVGLEVSTNLHHFRTDYTVVQLPFVPWLRPRASLVAEISVGKFGLSDFFVVQVGKDGIMSHNTA